MLAGCVVPNCEQRILSFCYEPTNRMNHRLAISPDLSISPFVCLSILCISVVHSVHRVWSYIKQTEKQTISTFFFMNQSTNHQCTVHEPFNYHPPLTVPSTHISSPQNPPFAVSIPGYIGHKLHLFQVFTCSNCTLFIQILQLQQRNPTILTLSLAKN